jgi:hypothetical protein
MTLGASDLSKEKVQSELHLLTEVSRSGLEIASDLTLMETLMSVAILGGGGSPLQSPRVLKRCLPRRIFPHSAYRAQRNQEAEPKPSGNHKMEAAAVKGSCSSCQFEFLLSGIFPVY